MMFHMDNITLESIPAYFYNKKYAMKKGDYYSISKFYTKNTKNAELLIAYDENSKKLVYTFDFNTILMLKFYASLDADKPLQFRYQPEERKQ